MVLAAIGACWLGGNAYAFVDTPTFEPLSPRDSELVTLVVRAGYCHGFIDSATRPTVTTQGHAIELIVMGVHETDANCVFGLEGYEYRYVLGAFPPGDYTVTLRMEHFADPEWDYELLASVPLTVRAVLQSPRTVPVSGCQALVAMILAILLAAATQRVLRGDAQ